MAVVPGALPPGTARSTGLSRYRGLSTALAITGAVAVWIALLGPVITLFDHLSWHALSSALSESGALQPLFTSLEAGGVTLAILVLLGTPLGWLLSRGELPVGWLFE